MGFYAVMKAMTATWFFNANVSAH